MLTFGYGAYGVNDEGQTIDNTPSMNIIIDVADIVKESNLKVDIGLEETLESYLTAQILMPKKQAEFSNKSIYTLVGDK